MQTQAVLVPLVSLQIVVVLMLVVVLAYVNLVDIFCLVLLFLRWKNCRSLPFANGTPRRILPSVFPMLLFTLQKEFLGLPDQHQVDPQPWLMPVCVFHVPESTFLIGRGLVLWGCRTSSQSVLSWHPADVCEPFDQCSCSGFLRRGCSTVDPTTSTNFHQTKE